MSERKVNLKEILISQLSANLQRKGASSDAANSVARTSVKAGNYWYILEAMKEACQQTLELAAENAETEKEMLPECGVLKSVGVVDKQSILDTINQVE